MSLLSTSTTTQCDFDQVGIFHFTIEFYVDENLTTLKFTDKTKDNPGHFFIDNQPFPAGGYTTALNRCYTLLFRPGRDFLISNDLINQVLFTKIEANLVEFVE